MSGSIGVEPRERLVPCSRSAAGDFLFSGEHLFPWHRQIRKVKRLSRRTCRHKVQYYETDQLGIVHHSNYIRWFEEARIWLMEVKDFGYDRLESMGIISPVLRAEADYRSMTRFGETVEIETVVESYTGVRISFLYTVRNKADGALRCTGRTEHCFLNSAGRPVALRKACPEYEERIRAVLAE